MGDYITPEDYSRAVEAMGLKRAQDWVRKHNITIADNASGGVLRAPEAQMEDEGELPPVGSDETDTGDTLSASPSAGGLGSLDAFRAYEDAQKAVNAQITANIDLLKSARDTLRERRVGPSNAEKWFAIAAALGKPTRTGSFGESIGNLGEVLGEQQAARRRAEEERDMLLEQYGLKIGNEQLRLAQSGATQAGQLYRAAVAAGKKPAGSRPGTNVGPDLVVRHKTYGTEIKQPPNDAIYVLQAYLKNPNNSPEDKLIARQNFDRNFGYGASEIFGGEY